MNHYPVNMDALLGFMLDGKNYQSFVDKYEEKYNGEMISGFVKTPPQLDYTFSQLIASTGATTLPAYVDPESPGYEDVMREMAGATGNIPTMKKFYRLNRVQLNRRLQLIQRYGNAALDPEMYGVLLGLLDEGTDGLIGGYYNALTHQRHQIVSNGGRFIIDINNNPRGLKGITIDFNVPASHKTALDGTDRWWTNATRTTEGSKADPIKCMKDWVKSVRREHHYAGPIHIEMAQDLFDDLLMHSKVVSRIGLSAYTSITDEATRQAAVENDLSDEAKARILSKLVGVTIVPQDTFGYVAKPVTADDGNPDIVTEQIENFKVNNIAIVPDGTFGEIQAVTPLTLGYEPSKVATFDGGRLVLSQRAVPQTHSIYIDSEAAPLCVPTMPQGMFVKTVCPHAND